MDANFFAGAPDPAADPRAFQNQQAMARALMARGVGGQGQGAAGVAGQLVNGLAGGYKANQLREATRASDILNGGTGQNGLQKVGSWLGGLLGGGA